MPPHLSELLQPSLSRTAPRRAPYAQQVHFLTAFFGGPLAAMAFNLLNSHRLERLRRDAPWLVAGLALALGLDAFLLLTEPGRAFVAAAEAVLGRNVLGLAVRVLALGLFVLGLVMHRREHQAADLMGVPRPSGWVLGIGLVLAGSLFESVWREVLR